MTAVPVLAQIYCRAETSFIDSPTMLNFPSNVAKDSPRSIHILSPSSRRSTQNLRQTSACIPGNRDDFPESRGNNSCLDSNHQPPPTSSDSRHRMVPIPMLRLALSVSRLRQTTARLCRPRVSVRAFMIDLPSSLRLLYPIFPPILPAHP